MPDLRYPVGPLSPAHPLTAAERTAARGVIAALPASLRLAVAGLTDRQLDTPYRPDGWTVRQVVHHVADSHINAYLRTKFALSEAGTTIKPYPEAVWAEMADSRTAPVTLSLGLLDALHERWLMVLNSVTEPQWSNTIVHPDLGVMTLDDVLAMYEWHSRHHVAHVTELRRREQW